MAYDFQFERRASFGEWLHEQLREVALFEDAAWAIDRVRRIEEALQAGRPPDGINLRCSRGEGRGEREFPKKICFAILSTINFQIWLASEGGFHPIHRAECPHTLAP